MCSETQKELLFFFFYLLNSKTTLGSDINSNKLLRSLAFLFVCFFLFFQLLWKVTKQLQKSPKTAHYLWPKRERAHSQAYVVCRILMQRSFFCLFFYCRRSAGVLQHCLTALSRVPVGWDSSKELIPFACLMCGSWAKFLNPMELDEGPD